MFHFPKDDIDIIQLYIVVVDLPIFSVKVHCPEFVWSNASSVPIHVMIR